jgi:NADH dehydrogenase
MRVAVIGGTGFVGNYLIDALSAAGHDLSVLVRPGSESKLPKSSIWRRVSGEIGDSTAVEAVIEGCNAVVYCIGILKEIPKEGVTFEALQYQGVVRAVDAAQQAGARRFLLMSANGVKVPGTAYQETKKRAEDYLLASQLDGTVFRPSVIFGDPRGQMEIATQLLRDVIALPFPAAGFINSDAATQGQIMMSPVHVEDVALAFVRALADDATIGMTYELGGPDEISWIEMIAKVAAATGRKKWIVKMPVRVMKFSAMLFDWLPFFPVTRDQLVMLEEGNTADPAVIESLLGRPPRAFDAEHLQYLSH